MGDHTECQGSRERLTGFTLPAPRAYKRFFVSKESGNVLQ